MKFWLISWAFNFNQRKSKIVDHTSESSMCWSAVWQREAFTFRQEISALTMLYWVHVDTATVSPREETNGPWTINEGNLRLRGNYH